MTEKITKLMGVFESFYQILLINALFLITNSFLFQVIFFIDFQVIFFPLYFLVSFPLLPSLVALLRSIDRLNQGNETKLLATYYREFLFTIKNEYKLWGGLLFAFYLTLTSLYTGIIGGPLTFFLYVLNSLLLVSEGLFSINVLSNALVSKKAELTKRVFSSFLPNAGKSFLFLLFSIGCLLAAFRLSFSLILVVFGLMLKIGYQFFTKQRKDFE